MAGLTSAKRLLGMPAARSPGYRRNRRAGCRTLKMGVSDRSDREFERLASVMSASDPTAA